MYNSVTLVGAVGKDIEIKTARTGQPMANVSVATWEYRKNSDGEWGKDSTWHNVLVYGNATKALENISKGDLVIVTGRISVREVRDETNEVRKIVSIIGYVRLVRKESSGGGQNDGNGQRGKGGGRENGSNAAAPSNHIPPAPEPAPFGHDDLSDLSF